MRAFLIAIGVTLLSPLAGGLLQGIDRKITARMQGRIGPPLLQPFYDLGKLLGKKSVVVNRFQVPFIACHLIFAALSAILLFEGSDILLIVFVLTLAGLFLVLAAYSTGSPYSAIGAERELLMMMGYEPMLILAMVGMYDITKSFNFYMIASAGKLVILRLPAIYLGLVYILAIKLRKSPFDLSTSHHAHQELVKGVTADLGGPALAMVELAHWYETVFLYAFIWLFWSATPWIGALGLCFTFLLEIAVDNATARLRWESMLGSAWLVALIMGAGNLLPLYLLTRP